MEPVKAIVQFRLPLGENSPRNLYSVSTGGGGAWGGASGKGGACGARRPLGEGRGLREGRGLGMAGIVGGAAEVNRQ